MRITKAVITAAKPEQRSLPLQLLVDRDATQKPALRIIVDEAMSAGVQEVCLVIHPGDRNRYQDALGRDAPKTHFVEQTEPLGYGQALACAKDFVEDDFFLHFVSDHVYVALDQESCAEQVVKIAEAHGTAVSAVQSTHQRYLNRYGVVRGRRREHESRPIYDIAEVLEKPSIEIAQERMVTPHLRAQHFLCFFGMHVFPPSFMQMLAGSINSGTGHCNPMAAALNELAKDEYMAVEPRGFRCNMGVDYGLLKTQIALVHAGRDAKRVLTEILGVLIEGGQD